MSLIDRATDRLPIPQPWVHFQAPLSDEPIPLTIPEAIAAVMVASISADGVRSGEELARLSNGLSTSRLFRQADSERDPTVAARAATLLEQYGREAMLAACVRTIPPDLRTTAFAIAADLVFADGRIDEREKAYVDELQRVLGVDDAIALQIVEVMAIKNRI
jgi:hypothetical protein